MSWISLVFRCSGFLEMIWWILWARESYWLTEKPKDYLRFREPSLETIDLVGDYSYWLCMNKIINIKYSIRLNQSNSFTMNSILSISPFVIWFIFFLTSSSWSFSFSFSDLDVNFFWRSSSSMFNSPTCSSYSWTSVTFFSKSDSS